MSNKVNESMFATSRSSFSVKKPIYSTYLNGQMLEARSKIDNYSQSESFFDTMINKNVFKGSPNLYQKIERKTRRNLSYSDSKNTERPKL